MMRDASWCFWWSRCGHQCTWWYEPFQDYAGAGASVPLLGFGNVLMKGVKEAVQEQGFLGLFAGGFKAGAVGTSAALISVIWRAAQQTEDEGVTVRNAL